MADHIVRQDHDGVAVLELNRPEVGNALDLGLARSLGEALTGVAADPRVRCVVLQGAGAHFCVGGDVAAMAAAPDRSTFIGELAEVAHRAILELASLEVPVVALVHGAAAGAGLALTLFADRVIAADTSTFLTAYAGIGLSPDCGMTWMLPRLVGLRRAQDLLLPGRRLTAPKAQEWGLITRSVPAGTLVSSGIEVAREIAAAPRPAIGATARLLRGDLRALERHLDREAAAIAAAAAGGEATALIDEFARRAGGKGA